MKRFYAICSALAVGILLVGSVHAGPPHSRQSSGHHSRQVSVQRWHHHSGRRWIVLPPRPELLPWQWLPEQSPSPWGINPDPGDYDPDSGIDDPNAEGYDPNNGTDDPNSGTSVQGGGIGGVNSTRQAVTPKGGNPRRLPRVSNGSSQIPVSPPRR